jgi:HJR/Mrr/RecB family endonuclease
MNGADVRWNEKIDGRQFDVVIYFKCGEYSYLTVIECKNYKSKIPAEKVEAFVTKSNGVKANKAVMFSSQGFQSGAHKVAKEHGVDLITLNEEHKIPNEYLSTAIYPSINIYCIKLIKKGKNKPIEFEEGAKLQYLAFQSFIIKDTQKISIYDFLARWATHSLHKISKEVKEYKIEIGSDETIRVPELGEYSNINAISFKVRLVDSKKYLGSQLDRYLIERSHRNIILSNHTNGNIEKVLFKDIDPGFDSDIIVENFYHSPSLGFDYFCKEIDGDLITWWLIESYQHGKRIDVLFTQRKKDATGYQKITNKKKLKKLRFYVDKL